MHRHRKQVHALWISLMLFNFLGCFVVNKYGPHRDPHHPLSNVAVLTFAYICIQGESWGRMIIRPSDGLNKKRFRMSPRTQKMPLRAMCFRHSIVRPGVTTMYGHTGREGDLFGIRHSCSIISIPPIPSHGVVVSSQRVIQV